MEALKRLETEVQKMNNHNVFVIFEYLKTREDLKEKFENEEKTIKGMFDFICDKARKQAVNSVAMIQDNIVYLWAVNYFLKSNEELGIKNEEKIKENQAVTTKIENQNKEEVMSDNQNQISLFNM